MNNIYKDPTFEELFGHEQYLFQPERKNVDYVSFLGGLAIGAALSAILVIWAYENKNNYHGLKIN